MRCVLCKQGNTRPGTTSLTLEQGSLTLVVKHVPAEVCQTCGEAYINGAITEEMQVLAEEKSASGVYVEVREFQASKAD